MNFMKMACRSLIVLCTLAVLFATSCSKPSVTGSKPVPVPDKSRLNTLFAAFHTTPQYLQVTAGAYHVVYGANGTKLSFYPNSFRDAKGNMLTSGTVTIRLVEVYSHEQMMADRVATTAGGTLLTSGGQVQILATMDGQEVFANKYGIGFKQRTHSLNPMALFYGDANNEDSVVNWSALSGNSVGTTAPDGTVIDSIADSSYVIIIGTGGMVDTSKVVLPYTNYYQFDSCTSFNWINCDYFYSSGAQLTDVTLIIPDTTFNETNTEVFIIFPSINSVAYMGNYSAGAHAFDLKQGYYIPVGMIIDIAVVSNINGYYYYYQQTGVTVTSGMSVIASMAQNSLSYIQGQMNGL